MGNLEGAGYLPTTVNMNEQQKNRMERFLDMFQYVPLNYNEIESIFV